MSNLIKSTIISVSITFSLTVLTNFAGINTLIPSAVGGILAWILAYTHPSYIRKRTSYDVSTIAPFIISEAKLVLSVTGSLFEVIRHIAESGFKWVSDDFSRLTLKVIQGNHPIRVIQEYLLQCDSQTLREGLIQLLAQAGSKKVQLYPFEFHARARFLEESERLAPQIAVSTAWFFFVPIILTIMIGSAPSLNESMGFGILMIFVVFSLLIRQFLGRKEAHLLH